MMHGAFWDFMMFVLPNYRIPLPARPTTKQGLAIGILYFSAAILCLTAGAAIGACIAVRGDSVSQAVRPRAAMALGHTKRHFDGEVVVYGPADIRRVCGDKPKACTL